MINSICSVTTLLLLAFAPVAAWLGFPKTALADTAEAACTVFIGAAATPPVVSPTSATTTTAATPPLSASSSFSASSAVSPAVSPAAALASDALARVRCTELILDKFLSNIKQLAEQVATGVTDDLDLKAGGVEWEDHDFLSKMKEFIGSIGVRAQQLAKLIHVLPSHLADDDSRCIVT